MSIRLDHTIVAARDQHAEARFFTEILGLPEASQFGHFTVVDLGNGVSLDFASTDQPIAGQHYAFLVGEDEFDAILQRITERGIEYWADPQARRPGEINRNDGGRGVYWMSPDGHFLEAITRPYGSG